uniref:Uncharacterized protein n=1 Tax=Ustilago esculenta TaxID=185366 RepID=A0A481SH31_9BASI|nr:hypothetical protein UE_1353 [Ustilago esculenta]
MSQPAPQFPRATPAPTPVQGPASRAGLMDTSAHARLDDQADLLTQLAESVTKIHQLVLGLCQDLAPLPVIPAPAPGLPPPASPPAPAEAKLGLLVNGVCVGVPKASTSGTVSRGFLCLLPNVCSFAQAWTVYTALRCTSTNDPHLSTSLGAFLVHVINLDVTFFWPAVAKYVVAVCWCRFDFASAGDWAEKDLNAWQEELGGAPQWPITTNSSGKPKAMATQASSSLSGPKCQRH